MRLFWLPLTAFLCFGQPSQISTAKPATEKTAFDKAAMEQYVRHLFVWGPQITVKISDPRVSQVPGFKEITVTASAGQATQEETYFVSADGRKILRGTAYDIQHDPFAADKAKLTTDLQPSFGAPGAPVVIVIFSDFQCSFCKEEAKVIRQNVAATYPEQIRVYFKDFPLDAIHPWARAAAIAGRCIFRQKPAAFWDYHDWIFENQAQITPENVKDKAVEFGKGKGVETIQLAGCIDTKATEAEINKSMAEARSLGINSTPTMFVNGRRLVGHLSWQQLKGILDHEIEYAKTHGGGEKCCEVKLPSPLNQ